MQEPFPLSVIFGNVWENTEAQLLFLKHAISAPPEVFTFAHSSRQLEYANFQADHESQPWLCLDLLEVLCQLAERGHATSVWSLLEFPLKSFSEMLLLAMAHTPYNLLQYEVCATVLPWLLKDASKKGIILRLWHVNSVLFSIALNDTVNFDLENMSRLVDLFHELEILLSVLDLVPMSLGIRLAALASPKEYINLEEWLTTKLIAHEDSFIEECLKFLKEVEDNSCEIWNIYKDTASTFSKEPFPLSVIFGNVWENTEAQLLFLKHAISAPPEVFTFAHSSRQLEYANFQADHESQPWLCLDLLEVLCQLAERGHATSVWSLLEFPLKSFSEMLLLAMAHTPYNLLQYEVCATVLPWLLKDASKKGIILRLWHVNSVLFSIALNDTVNFDLENMSRLVDLFHELEILLSVLDLVPMSLGIRLAALASPKEYINLEEWLTTKLIAHEDSFIEECLKFLKEVEDNSCEIWNIYKDTASTFSKVLPMDIMTLLFTFNFFLVISIVKTNVIFKVLQLHTCLLSSDRLCEKMESLYVTCMDSNPKKENPRAPDGSSKLYEDHVSEKATSYIQQMFCGQLTVGEMVNMLAQFQESFEKRDNMVFECIISSLCEDYKFFNQYPDEHLMMAADLFGLLIRYHLVSHYALDIFLKAVLEALHEPEGSKMFVFGTKALEHIVDRLIEWPEYSRKLLQISHIRSTRSELISVIEQTVARTSLRESAEGQNPSTNQSDSSITPANIEIPVSSSSFTGSDGAHLDSQVLSPIDSQQNNKGHLDERHMDPNSPTSGQISVATSSASPQSMTSSSEKLRAVNIASFGSAASIETLLAAAESNETSIETPPSDIQDKISLIINNLSAANTDTRAKECKDILDEQYYTWFAQYLVMKRASMEPNFHMLYIDFVEKINSKHLNKELVEASYQNCKVLLNSPLIKSSDNERKLLKNLGGWIGKITIGKNQVLRAKHIDPKSLIVEAYTKGLMIGVIPFTSKILESCKNSLAYQPPNPWTMAILGLLTEIHAMKNLKANLKFEIEILFKNLEVDMLEVNPSSLLKNRVRIVEGNPDFANNSSGSYQKRKDKVTSNSTVRSVLNQVKSPVVAAGPSDQSGNTHMPLTAAGASYRSHVLHQNADQVHPPLVMLGEDEKKVALCLPNQLPLPQGPQVAQFPNMIPLRAPIIPDLELFRLNKFFQSVLPVAMKMALEEVISSFVKRSVSLATTTTIELIMKDYSTELDDDYIVSASCRMVSSLAGEFSYVTSKELLREKLSTNLRNFLQGLDFANNLTEHAMQPVIDENLESGCDFIEKTAIDEGQTIVTREITEKLSAKRKQREAFHPRPGDFSFFQHQVLQRVTGISYLCCSFLSRYKKVLYCVLCIKPVKENTLAKSPQLKSRTSHNRTSQQCLQSSSFITMPMCFAATSKKEALTNLTGKGAMGHNGINTNAEAKSSFDNTYPNPYEPMRN
ncbi:CCR4-Not complex component, Not1, C-terminal [Artemisia annua]|uniref:CCR4-Not complex component, Not1, C-terminal n=1 Tax=Artemisia annua TaxID=35608 RepID=A0A2U1MJM7_ARTAN|nr:CCR4-Not complex component, Not1, C-terminal [Artemisia annua]